ncbi:MAG: A24 family peptidase [Gammaproteobacteria bacterium]|nr:A24 family peptidase [Gammaproteobacteria bacterium]MDH5800087.1 A24 family peptidase [Gammaproteobacteria bacterium]
MDDLLTLLQSSSAFLIGVTTVAGLIVGSFLNVVIHRLPIMLKRDWKQQCEEFLQEDETVTLKSNTSASHEASPRYNLITPASTCPQCGHKIKAVENIPVISYLILKGKCAHCKTAISLRYPIIETVTALLSATVAWHFGYGLPLLAALFLTWALISLTMIDFDHQLLPDDITLPYLWLGLLLALSGVFTDIHSSVIGAIAGYLSLWLFYWAFKLLTGKEGMGFGDFKLFALFGAWLGWQMLPLIILLSSLVGALVGISLVALRGRDKNIPIPFGPYLAAAGWIALLWGQEISNAYLKISGIS